MSRDFFSPVNLLRPSRPGNAGNQVPAIPPAAARRHFRKAPPLSPASHPSGIPCSACRARRVTTGWPAPDYRLALPMHIHADIHVVHQVAAAHHFEFLAALVAIHAAKHNLAFPEWLGFLLPPAREPLNRRARLEPVIIILARCSLGVAATTSTDLAPTSRFRLDSSIASPS